MRKLPPATGPKNLSGIFKIIREHNFDEIRVGEKIVGDLCFSTIWHKNEEIEQYTFYAFDDATPFETRNSYAECWVDVLTTIANNQSLAIEFTIKVNQKLKNQITPQAVTNTESVAQEENA